MNSIERFKIAQADCYKRVLQEMHMGKKSSHWMWFIFPQIIGLGRSKTSKKYAIVDFEEARAFLNDELLSHRYIELTDILAKANKGKTACEIFDRDQFKFKSSLTLFKITIDRFPELNEDGRFQSIFRCLEIYFNNELDESTLKILSSSD
jgi:uncharacterized protein (DUF1810 family)